MKSNVVTAKYSKALFDITYQNGTSGLVATQLKEISKAMSAEILSFFSNPFNTSADKKSVINSTFEGKTTVEVLNFMAILADKNRMNLIADISAEYSTLVQTAAGITKGKIFCSHALDKAYINQVEAVVSKTLNQKIELTFEKDETLIAGYKVQVGGWTLDDSANTHLKILKDELMKRGL